MEVPTSVVVRLFSWWRLAQALLAMAVIGGVGVFVTLLPVVGTGGNLAKDIVAVVFGVLLATLGIGLGIGMLLGLRPQIIVDPVGVRWESPRLTWALPWTELSEVCVHVGHERSMYLGVNPFRKRRPGMTRVHLELVLADEAYAARHPTMAHLQKKFTGGAADRYGIPFAQRRELIAPIDDALRAFAGAVYRPVRDDGELIPGKGYERA